MLPQLVYIAPQTTATNFDISLLQAKQDIVEDYSAQSIASFANSKIGGNVRYYITPPTHR